MTDTFKTFSAKRGPYKTAKAAQATSGSTTTKPEIQHLGYRPQAHYQLDLEVFSMADLRERVKDQLGATHRYEFHTLVFVTHGVCTQVVDFKSIACATGSLLVGNYEQNITNFNITPVPTNSFSTSRSMRVVPVAELEVGGSWRLTPRCVLTGGWLVQSWWDLGMQEITSTNDDANILGFDGFFARAEMVF